MKTVKAVRSKFFEMLSHDELTALATIEIAETPEQSSKLDRRNAGDNDSEPE